MKLYRIGSSAGTFLVDPEMAIYEKDMAADIKFFSDRENIDKWLLISLQSARMSVGGNVSFNELVDIFEYYMEEFDVADDILPEAIETSTYNRNIKSEYKLNSTHMQHVQFVNRMVINEIPDWDAVFPSDWHRM